MTDISNTHRRSSKSQQIFDVLRHEIVENILKPGEPISKEHLCKRFAVSRTPATDALSRLAELGLVDIFPQHGTFVSKIKLGDIEENSFLRECIETGVVRRLAGSLSQNEISQLETNMRIQRFLAGTFDLEGFYKHDKEFHSMLVSFSGLRKVEAALQPVLIHLERARKLIVLLPERVTTALDEHEAILLAIKGSDPTEAERAMRTHLSESMRAVEGVIEDNPELAD
ncbi:MAG: GntR family transcriptional regulator [Rhodobacteraceae bacterium]|nr:GntR family transcriptional regulator [Paracoccaceae bacterium]